MKMGQVVSPGMTLAGILTLLKFLATPLWFEYSPLWSILYFP